MSYLPSGLNLSHTYDDCQLCRAQQARHQYTQATNAIDRAVAETTLHQLAPEWIY